MFELSNYKYNINTHKRYLQTIQRGLKNWNRSWASVIYVAETFLIWVLESSMFQPREAYVNAGTASRVTLDKQSSLYCLLIFGKGMRACLPGPWCVPWVYLRWGCEMMCVNPQHSAISFDIRRFYCNYHKCCAEDVPLQRVKSGAEPPPV